MVKSTVEAFFETAARQPGRPAWIHGGRSIAWSEAARMVRRVAKGLIARGVKPGEAVCIIGPNKPEWVAADLGAMAAGAVPAPIYPTLTAEQQRYIQRHCEARVSIALGPHLLEGDVVTDFEAFLASGDAVPDSAVDERVAKLEPRGLATLIYTSGTTGPPKAVMLSYDNLLYAAQLGKELLQVTGDDIQVSYLPLSHVAEQMLTIHGPATTGAQMWFADKLETAAEVFREARPTIFFAVPRVWEKMQAKIAEGLTSPLKRLLVRAVPKLVHKKLGLDRARLLASGAALLSLPTQDFFEQLGLPICDIYGMSESTAVTSANLPHQRKAGTVGKLIPGAETRIAPDGEILTRGRHVFLGYYKDEAATRETIDAEGFLHTGDVGVLDPDGYLRITDRKRDILVTSGGKNVSPQNLEALLVRIPGVAHAVVVGDARKHLAALIVPEGQPDAARIAQGVTTLNAQLPSYETIKKFRILPVQFSIESGELTPTMKLKRKAVNQKFAAQIDELFREPPGAGVHVVSPAQGRDAA